MTNPLNHHVVDTLYAYTETIEQSLTHPSQWRKVRLNTSLCSGPRYFYGPWRDTREKAETDKALTS